MRERREQVAIAGIVATWLRRQCACAATRRLQCKQASTWQNEFTPAGAAVWQDYSIAILIRLSTESHGAVMAEDRPAARSPPPTPVGPSEDGAREAPLTELAVRNLIREEVAAAVAAALARPAASSSPGEGLLCSRAAVEQEHGGRR